MATGIPPKSRQILKNLQPKLIKPIWCSFPPSATFIVRWLWCGYHVLVKMTGYNCHSVGQNPLLRMSMTRNAARNVPHPKAGHRMFQVPAWMGGPCSVACAETPAGHFAITKRKVVGVATFYHQLVGFPDLFCGTNSANMLLLRLLFPTCHVRVVRFYVSWPAFLLLLRPPPPAGPQLQALDHSVPHRTQTATSGPKWFPSDLNCKL